MKLKNRTKGLIAIIMAVVMLAGIILPAAALSIPASGSSEDDGLCYTLSYKDGVLSLVIDSEKLYEVIKDKGISKDELDSFLPADVVETLQKGGEVSPEDMMSLISSYITLDDVTAIIGDMPEEMVAEFFDPALIEKLIDVKELLGMLQLDEIMESLDDEDLEELLGEEGVIDILLPKIVDSDLIEKVLEEIDLTPILNDTEVRGILEGILKDETKLNELLEIEIIKTKVNEYMMGDTVINNLIAHREDLHTVFEYITTYNVSTPEGQKKHDKFISFMQSEEVLKILMTPKYIINEHVVADLIEAQMITVESVEHLLDGNGKAFSDFVDEEGLFNSEFVDKIFDAEVLTPELLRDILDADKDDVTARPGEVHDAIEVLFKTAIEEGKITADNIVGIDGIVDYDEVKTLASGIAVEKILAQNVVVITGDINTYEVEQKLGFTPEELATIAHGIGIAIDITDPEGSVERMSDTDKKRLLVELNTNQGVSSGAIIGLSFVGLNVTGENINWFLTETGTQVTELLADGYTDKILAEDTLVEKIAATVTSDDPELSGAWDGVKTAIKHSTAVESVITSSHGFVELVEKNLSGIVEYIDTKAIAEWLIGLDLGEDDFKKIFGDKVVDANDELDTSKLLDAISHDSMVEILDAIVKDTDTAKKFLGQFVEIYNPMTETELIEDMGGYHGLVEKYADLPELVEYIGVSNLLDALEQIGYDLFGEIGTDKILEYVSIKQIIDSAGGIEKFVGMYDTAALMDVFRIIGVDGLREFVTKNGLLEVIDVKALATDVLNYVKENTSDAKAALKELALTAYRVLMTRVDSMTVNGTKVFYGAQFDLNNIVVSILSAIPEKVTDIIDNGLSLSAGITMRDTDENGNKVVGKTYEYSINVSFEGEKDNLRGLFESFDDNLSFKFTQDNGAINIDVDAVLPSAIASAYETLLTTEKLPAAVRQDILRLPGSTLGEAGALLESIAKNGEIFDTLNEKLDTVREKAYEKIDGKLSDNAAVQKAKAKVDELLAKLSDKQQYDALVDKAVGYLDKLAKGKEDKLLLDALYKGDGLFSGSRSIEGVDIITDVIEKVVDVPNKLEALFKNTVFTGTVNADITLTGIYKVTFTALDGDKFTTMLAEGMSLDILADVTGYDGELVDADGQTVSVMPGEDTELFEKEQTPPPPPVDPEHMYVTFRTEDGGVLAEDVEFDYNTPIEDILKYVQDNFKKTGYTVNIEDGYDPEAEYQDVTVVYVADTYYITWYEDESLQTQVGDSIAWSFDDIPDLDELTVPTFPERKGYRAVGWSLELTEDSFKTAGDISIYAIWEKVEYTATFVGEGRTQEVKFTIDDIQKGYIAEPQVPYKYGHEGKWAEYKLDYKDITVNAEYTLKEYTATFVADGEVVGTTTFTVEDEKLVEPPVPEKDGYVGNWEDYEITDSDITVNAVYTPIVVEDEGEDEDRINPLFYWIGLILVMLIVAGGIFGYFKMQPKPDPEPEPEPEPEAEPEPEPEPEEIVVPVVEEISAEEVDSLMTDTTAMSLLKFKATGAGAGMRSIVNLNAINDTFSAGDTVTIESLKEKGLIPSKARRVKVLANGTLDKPLDIEADSFSVQAVKMITLTGGTATQTVVELE